MDNRREYPLTKIGPNGETLDLYWTKYGSAWRALQGRKPPNPEIKAIYARKPIDAMDLYLLGAGE